MTEEEKKAAEAQANEKKEADAAFETSLEGLSDEEKDAKRNEREGQSNDNGIDYEAELKLEREAREKAERKLAGKRFKESEEQRKEREAREAAGEEDLDEEDLDEDKPLTGKQLQQILAKERAETTKTLQSTQIENIAKAMAKSDAEKNLIIEIHKNRSFPPHLSLQDQLEEAYVIANRKKLIGERNEALRALRGKQGANDGGETSHHESLKLPNGSKLPASQEATLKHSGFVLNTSTKLYEKVLKNGSKIIHDPKTKKNTFQKAR